MNKLEANLVLLSVACFWGMQYVFFRGIPAEISTFAFMTLSYAIGFVLLAVSFQRLLRRVTRKLLKQSLMMALPLFAGSTLLTFGARLLDPSVTGFLASAYVIFVPILLLLLKKKVTASNFVGIALVVLGLLLATGFGWGTSIGPGVWILLLGDLFFAIYLVVVDAVAGDANPMLLSMGQMGYSAIFSLILWVLVQPETIVSLPRDTTFWGVVLFAALFIRAFTTVMQIYAQRYVSTMNVSLVLSCETVFTLLSGSVLAPLLGTTAEPISLNRMAGCVLLIGGVLVSNNVFLLPRKRKEEVT